MKKYVFESLKFFCAAILCTILSAFATPARAALPSGYTQLEYIESTGTQYIDTLLPVKSNTLPEVIYQQTSCSGTGSVFGQVGGSITNLLAYRTHSSDNVFWFARLNPVACDTSKHTVVFNSDGKLYKDGTAIGTRGEFGSGSSLPMLLFAISSDNNTIKYGTVKIFSFKVKEGDALVRDMVPAKNASGKIGMYDTVNDVFYENAGSGSFIAGPIACNGTIVNYTSATGTGVQNGTPTPTNPIEPTFYKQGNMVLRKVGDVADSYDATTGKITRRVGVKVLDGTENTINTYNMLQITAILNPAREKEAGWQKRGLCTHAIAGTATSSSRLVEIDATATYFGGEFGFTAESGKQWLRDQYAAGTPVTLYYPLAEPVVEDWTETSYCETPIKIATTKYNETAFGPLNTALANAISVVDSVVSNTITQAASIATLQAQKQTRPADDPSDANNAENCPAYKQCLLVEDENGTPHWYEITDPFRDFVAPIIANNVAPASTTNSAGYTQLEYIESTGEQYIDTGIVLKGTDVVEVKYSNVNRTGTSCLLFGYYKANGNNRFAYNFWRDSIMDGYLYYGAEQEQISTPPTNDGLAHIIKMGNGSLYHDSTLIKSGMSSNFTASENMFLFASSGTSLFQTKARVHYAKIYNDGTLVRNFIPAKRNSDGAIGMYDTVSRTFFTNSGTGTFTDGPVVANTDVPSNPTWTATWTANATTGVAAGTVYGEGLCNAVTGTASTAATSAQMSSANWSVDGANCWCKASGLTVGEEYSAAPSSISWVFRYTGSSAADCATNCASGCAYGVRTYASFRSAAFGM